MTHVAQSGDGEPRKERTRARPPRGFRPAEGVRSAWSCGEAGPFGRAPSPIRGTAAQKAGLRYERKVHEHLSSVFGSLYRPSQWFRFEDQHGRMRWCQPDGLLCVRDVALVFEVKARHTSDAWWQLRRLYAPVVSRALYARTVGLCCIVRSYDASVPFPEPLEWVDDLRHWAEGPFDRMGVFSWKP